MGYNIVNSFIEDRSKIPIIGSISTPIALFVTGFASLSLPEAMQAPSPLVPALKSNWLMMHVTVMMLSYASLIVGSVLSIFFLSSSSSRKKNRLKFKVIRMVTTPITRFPEPALLIKQIY